MAENNVTSVMNVSATENSNRTTNVYDGNYLKPPQELFPTRIINNIFNIIYALGILANFVLLLYLIYFKRYQTPVFCVILSLGIADLCGCTGSLINYTLVYPFILGPLWLCMATTVLTQLAYLSSSYHISLFAILRFVQLVYPLTAHSKVTTSVLLKICVAIWSIHSIQVIFCSYQQQSLKVSIPGASDVYVCIYTGGNVHVIHLLIIIVWCCVPFLTTSGFHIAKQVVVMLSHKVTATSQDARVQRRQTDSRALAIVIVTYLVTMLPYIVQALRVYVLSITDNPIQFYLVEVFAHIAITNSAVNPWIYLFAAESVRSDIKNILSGNKFV